MEAIFKYSREAMDAIGVMEEEYSFFGQNRPTAGRGIEVKCYI